MYIKNINANIIIVLFVCVIAYIILIFPIKFNGYLFLKYNDKKMYFSSDLYGFLSVLGGYAHLIKDGLAIHITNKKVILIMYKKLISYRKSIRPVQDYHVKEFNGFFEIGMKEMINSFNTAFLFSLINNATCYIMKNKKNYVRVINDFYITEENRFDVYVKIGILFNNLMLMISLIKIIIGKLIYARKK